MRFIAKPDTWFDEGSEVKLVDDYRNPSGVTRFNPLDESGLFEGFRLGRIDQEICLFEEFDILE